MARGRTSNYAHLKEAVIELLGRGKSHLEICKIYPEIPPRTIVSWKEQAIRDGVIVEVDPEEPPENVPNNVRFIFEKKPKVPVVSEDDDLPDLIWATRSAKKIYNYSDDDSIKLKAIDTVLKAVSIRANKPELAEMKTETEEAELDYSQLSEQDLAQLYRERLSG